MVGFIQSLFHSFGSGIVAYGIPFQNKAFGFSPVKGLPNYPEPRKRPLHTLSILGIQCDDNSKYLIGCAGGDLRPQIHTRIFENLFLYQKQLGHFLL